MGPVQYCSRCGAKGERFSWRAGLRLTQAEGASSSGCPVCHYQAQADFNASVNLHHSFFREFHWQPRLRTKRLTRPVWLDVRREMAGEGTPDDPAQARSQTSEHVKVVGLLLVQRGHVPTHMPSRTASHIITHRNAAGTLMG